MYCKSYFFWFIEDMDSAIKFSSEAVELENQNATISGLEPSHYLALALRDTKNISNVEKALDIFLDNRLIDEYISLKDDFISDLQLECR
jgi:hypothetical protein